MRTQPPDNRLEVISTDIALPGCRLTAVALAIPKPDAPTFKRVGQYLQTVDACRAWWWGDFLNAYCAWRLDQENTRPRRRRGVDATEKEVMFVHYTSEFAEAAGVEEGTLRDWRMLARFYEVGCRQPTLSWSHHWEAWAGAGGKVSVAINWLKDAQAYCWSKTELRAHIREAAAADSGGSPQPFLKVQELIAFSRWARAMAKQLPALKPADVRAMRADLEPAVELARQLDAQLGKIGKK